jgi:anti-sigma regulatory factor (Ser/Thr protein kinase)
MAVVRANNLPGDDSAAAGERPTEELGEAAEMRLELSHHPSSAGMARRAVGLALTKWGCESIADDVLLVTSELVTNAIVHTAQCFTLTLRLTPSALRVEVGDADKNRPTLRAAELAADGGRGMFLVASCSSAWSSYRTHDGGKVVYCEVARPSDVGPLPQAPPPVRPSSHVGWVRAAESCDAAD